ncbi:hypothetical protein ACNQFZ_18335 [Schinkia sp. CFF1]
MVDYKECMVQTINEIYPKYHIENIIKALKKDNLVYFENQLVPKEGAVDLTGIFDEKTQLKKCITESKIILSKVEEIECKKAYKYSIIFKVNDLFEETINQLVSRGIIKTFQSIGEDNDVLFKDTSSIIPTKYDVDENIFILKFSRLLSGFSPDTQNKLTLKYPILAVIYKDLNILELRFEQVKGYLRGNNEYFYVKQTDAVLDWLEENLNCEIEAINISPVIEHISKKDTKEVYVSAQAMNLKSKKKAILDTGENDEDVLPLLGELKALIKENQDLFEKSDDTIEIKEILENFILETEEKSDLPWISLTWKNESKSKAIKVKFQFNYNNQDYSLLQYYFSNKNEMERMNYVTRYLIENKREVDELFDEPGDETTNQ